MSTVRINLHVYAFGEGSSSVYYPHHIGMFPQAAVKAIVDNLNIIGMAYNSNVTRQSGHVTVATAVMGKEPGGGPETIVRFADYEPPRAPEEEG